MNRWVARYLNGVLWLAAVFALILLLLLTVPAVWWLLWH